MQLICLSVSHHNAPVELRECLSLPVNMVEEAAAQAPIRTGTYAEIDEMVVLSTCNRLEIYALVSPAGEGDERAAAFDVLLGYAREVFALPAEGIGPYFRRFAGAEVVQHLYRVTSGLDSIALGETQILGQVSRALDTALQTGSARHVLSSLFRSAIFTGKRVRTETEIGRKPTSISAVAIHMVETATGPLAGRTVLVIGAGKMGTLTVDILRASGVKDVILASRTDAHAAEIAGRYGISALPIARLMDGLAAADVVFTSTAAPAPILRREAVAGVMAGRAARPIALVDLAVPRNVETGVSEISGVRLYDMDDLQAFAGDSAESSHLEIARAGAIVDEETAAYEKLLRVIPVIGELHKKVEEIRQREVERTLRHLHDTTPDIAEQIEILSRSLVRKILHEPTMHLRTENNQEVLNDYLDTLTRLFDLNENEKVLAVREHSLLIHPVNGRNGHKRANGDLHHPDYALGSRAARESRRLPQ
jgi:glutamyl-tRNA reductase